MNRRTFIASTTAAAAFGLAGCATSRMKNTDTRCFEIRTYYSPPGRLDDLHARFRNHTMKIFTRHGIENIAYWVPVDNTENKLVYLLGYPSREAREASWKAFFADPEWKEVAKKTEANGRIVSKVEIAFYQTTDYSPAIRIGDASHGGVFEQRIYTTPTDRLPNLDARFRDHTLDLFTKHGMRNWGYFHKMADQPGASTNLTYFLTHKSKDAAKASFDAFRQDPKWIAAKAESEKVGGGSLTVQDGVKSVFLVPTDYSPTK
jgi:hypothetical protein